MEEYQNTRRWLWLHSWRQPGRTILVVLLAAAMLLGNGYLQCSIQKNQARIEELYQTVLVTGELLQADGKYLHGGGMVPAALGEQLEALGVFSSVTKVIGGSADAGTSVTALTGTRKLGGKLLPTQEGRTVRDLIYRAVTRAEDCPELQNGSITVRYLEGQEDTFFTDTTELRAAAAADVLRELQIQPGERITLRFGEHCLPARVVGVISGETRESDCRLLLPTGALTQALQQVGESWAYCVYTFTVDPMENRRLPEFRVEAEELLQRLSGPAELFLLLRDEELTQAVEPLERNVTLLRVLYPVSLALSAALAAGTAAMLVLQSRRELAILRLLGLGKRRTGGLAVRQVFDSALLGSLLGLAAALLLGSNAGQSFLCGGLFLLGSILGGGGTAAAILRKNPLELLQTKE